MQQPKINVQDDNFDNVLKLSYVIQMNNNNQSSYHLQINDKNNSPHRKKSDDQNYDSINISLELNKNSILYLTQKRWINILILKKRSVEF